MTKETFSASLATRRLRLRPVIPKRGIDGIHLIDPNFPLRWVISEDLWSALSLCDHPNSIEEHSRHMAATLRMREDDRPEIEDLLASCISNGLLISDTELLKEVPSVRRRSKDSISRIAIITMGNRPTLTQAMGSQLENARASGHAPAVLLVLGSAGSGARSSVEETLKMVRVSRGENFAVETFDFDHRRPLVSRLTRETGVPHETVSFALFGDSINGPGPGSSRNLILLLTTGEQILCVDDDTECRLNRIGEDDPITLFPKVQRAHYTLSPAPDIDGLMARARWSSSASFMDVHQRLLGATLSECVSTFGEVNVRIGDAGTFVSVVKQRPESYIVTTQSGLLGDCARSSILFFLYADPALQEQWCLNDQLLIDTLRSRMVLQGATEYVVDAYRDLMSYAFGLDNSRLLPPFCPVLRGEDTIFGVMTSLCTSGLHASIPWGIVHRPEQPRKYLQGHLPTAIGGSFSYFLTHGLIQHFGSHRVGAPASFAQVGSYLADVSQSSDVFREWTKSTATKMLHQQMALLKRCLEGMPKRQSIWRTQVHQTLENVARAIDDVAGVGPTDIIPSLPEGWEYFRKLVASYGRLVTAWPQLTEAARHLKNSGDIAGLNPFAES